MLFRSAEIHPLVVSAEQAVAAALHERGDLGRQAAGRAAGEARRLEARERELLVLAVEQGDFDAAGRVKLDGAFEELALARAQRASVGGEGEGEEKNECPQNTRIDADGKGSDRNHSEGRMTRWVR